MFSLTRKRVVALAGFSTLALTAAIPATIEVASQKAVAETAIPVPQLAYEMPASVIADDQVVAAQIQEPVASAEIPAVVPTAAKTETAAIAESELECVAKVVHHEAANQSRLGQLAVAQLIVNRMGSGRFPRTACGVANQRGQFFPTAGYNPSRDGARWRMAMEVAQEALSGQSEAVVPGAIFYHAAYQAPTRWFRTRARVGALGDHIFYR